MKQNSFISNEALPLVSSVIDVLNSIILVGRLAPNVRWALTEEHT